VKRRWPLLVLPPVVALLGALAWAGFAPIRLQERERLFEIPAGTYERRMSGDLVEILPPRIRLTLGVDDILHVRNLDAVPQVFGPTVVMPGQSFRMPFDRAAEYQFVCSAHASGQLTIEVQPEPRTPWTRIRWRVLRWREAGSR
jgi:hypothetical protein